MKYGVLITARLKSKRLKKKLLKKIKNQNLISFLINRLKIQFPKKKIVLITSKLKQDKPLIDISKNLKINFFCGESLDVLKRIYDAAEKFKFSNIISCTADNPFIDTRESKKMIKFHIKNNHDLTIMKGLPIGMFTYGVKVSAIKKILKIKRVKNTETWGPYFFGFFKFNVGYYKININPKYRKLRLTVDEKEDLDLANKILSLSKDSQPNSIQIFKIFDKNPKLFNINSHIKQKPINIAKFKI